MTVLAPLNTVQAIIDDVRTMLLDKRQPYRYTDDELMTALNTALLEGRRMRADLFVTRWGNEVPYYQSVSGEPFCVEPQFRLAFVFGVCAHALLRDDEEIQDERADGFLTRFHDMLSGTAMRPIQGATPRGRQQE